MDVRDSKGHLLIERLTLRADFTQEALESWEDYQATGRHLTLAELQIWLASWGADAEAEAPECHA